jgi:uncharacterized protein YbcC (UPF0753/DUF2309 family)
MTETIQQLKEDIAILQEKLQKLEETNSPAEEAFKKVFRHYPNEKDFREGIWFGFEKGYNASQKPEKGQQVKELVKESVKWCEENPDKDPLDWLKPQTPEQVADGLKEAFREAVEQGVVSSKETPQERGERVHKEVEELITKIYDGYGVVSSSTKPQNLYDLIADCMVKYNSTVYPKLICDILDAVKCWLPDEHYSDGEDYDLGWNACLKFMRANLL